MTDVVDLCAAIETMIRTADPARRRAVARAFDGYAATFPANYDWAVSGQAPALLHFLMGAIEMTCTEVPSKPKPNLRVVEFKKMEPAHVQTQSEADPLPFRCERPPAGGAATIARLWL
jgi:hypothetical protein